ncbi:HNH endonuclease [Paraburkholderia phenazinium]|uniref:HNH endonuclease n=1 Tax=Paraburkholderia phenazinium TaxID=60549 RepID=A0A1G7ZNU4_9BURK|nr:HNH endonuclease signature motif containing protein [Paraburkholderia phenazinium]SDH10421.1 HNH endonuclease [Paraburkholderia phenazinium]
MGGKRKQVGPLRRAQLAYRAPISVRIEMNIERVPECGCWIWMGAVNAQGYGFMKANGRQGFAHRWSFEAHNGEIPKGMVICHRCDVPACVNPNHLFLGTYLDNAKDCVKKNRQPALTRNGKAKLTIESAARLRAMRENGASLKELSLEFGITQVHACRVSKGAVWPAEDSHG